MSAGSGRLRRAFATSLVIAGAALAVLVANAIAGTHGPVTTAPMDDVTTAPIRIPQSPPSATSTARAPGIVPGIDVAITRPPRAGDLYVFRTVEQGASGRRGELCLVAADGSEQRIAISFRYETNVVSGGCDQ